jgi:ABC transport system ATP-binding/permease protein
MNIISLEDVSKSYGIKPLFEGVTFGLDDGEKVGVIGTNGSGKSTLLRIIAGNEQPDTGRAVGEPARHSLPAAEPSRRPGQDCARHGLHRKQ